MNETPIEPIAPHDLLNAVRKAPAVDPHGEQKLEVAKEVFIALLIPTFQSGKPISQTSLKEAAVIAADAAAILLERLAVR